MLCCLPVPPRDSREGRGQSDGHIVLRLIAVRSLGSGAQPGQSAGGIEDVPVLRIQRLPQ